MAPLTAENKPNTLQPPSVLVLSRNDQASIGASLRCMSFSNDVVVLDACSTDRTAEIAGTFPNVRVVQREFDTEHQQLNHAVREIEFDNPWVYICEADELLCDGVADEMTRVVNQANQPHAAYELRRKQM
jgi:hypothetical protein